MNSLAQRLPKFPIPGTARDLLSAFARSDALPLVLLAVLVVVVFYDIVFLGKTLQTSSFLWGTLGARPPFGFPETPDYNVYILDPLATAVGSEPIVEKLSSTIRDFELPLWNADTAMGRPLLASHTPELTNPLRLPVAIWPSPEMWDAYLLARFDGAVESWTEDNQDKPKSKPKNDSHIVRADTVGGSHVRHDAAAARLRMLETNYKMGREPIRPTTPNQ